VIEGIALRVDPSYSIVQECFPYLARRLLVDNDPRIQVPFCDFREKTKTQGTSACCFHTAPRAWRGACSSTTNPASWFACFSTLC